ncbi:hypothetical protein FRC04_004205 [Tulasnella sp. 424]|nr:hypothetical protein FRC04_004205 [Tulasnella sp. 424]KAG8964038.1 hypothetical protein FRC05_004322 [Tulasnella sp. 425]
MGQIFSETFPSKPTFEPARDIPDLTGKVMIVTGGNSGVGKETVKALVAKNARVYLAARSKIRADQAIVDIKAETGKEAIFLELDLASLDSVTRAANEFKRRETELHVLFNNGGVMIPPIEQLTADGYDLQFGTNVLGHAHLTLLLIPELIAGAKTNTDGKARVVNTSSSAVYYTNTIDFELLTDTPKRKKTYSSILYGVSKLGNVVFSNELARRYADQGIVSNSVNPGNLKTELQRHANWFQNLLLKPILFPAPYGALTQLWVGTAPEAGNYNGAWFFPWAQPGRVRAATKNQELGTKLWDWIEEQRKGHF